MNTIHRSPSTVHGSLSVVLATRNEEENIGRCLESVKNIASEIVVVDEYLFTVHHPPFTTDYLYATKD
ncbi:MAG: hypothetical protein NT162_01055 [Candidatus Woesebacteria bacterium]|nr:hypothetical protein [Candidatus Woesebacteria bacterium]